MKESIPFQKLQTWAKNHEDNLDALPFKSLSAAITLGELESFIADARRNHAADFNAIKFYFVRYEFTPGGIDPRIERATTSGDLSQVSLVLVPAKVTDSRNWLVKALKDQADPPNILTLRVCDPASDASRDETGMCPPKCPNDDDGDNG